MKKSIKKIKAEANKCCDDAHPLAAFNYGFDAALKYFKEKSDKYTPCGCAVALSDRLKSLMETGSLTTHCIHGEWKFICKDNE